MSQPSESSRAQTLLMALICEGGMAVVAWLIGLALTRPPLGQIQFTTEAVTWGVVATLPMLVLFLGLTHFPVGPLKPIRDVVAETIVPMFRESGWVDLAIISALAGIGEEMLFRGVVQEAISHKFGPWVGLAAASIAFGLAHPINKAYGVLAALIGVYLGGLWMWTGNLLVPMITHGLYDFVALVYLLWRYKESRE